MARFPRQPEDRVQWAYAAKDNSELAQRYDRWAGEYDSDLLDHFDWSGPQAATALFLKHVLAVSKVLDAGAGTGLVGERLAARGYKDVHAIDLSRGMLAVARKKGVYKELRRMTLGEPLAFPDGAFDAVISAGVFTTGHAPPHAFDELVRITRAGGMLVFTLREDVYDQGFQDTFERLTTDGRWRLVERSDPYRPLPKGEPDVVHRVWAYRAILPRHA